MTLTDFSQKVAVLCLRHNCSVTSWFRTDMFNEMIDGSSPSSQHLLGLAVDIVPDEEDDWDVVMLDARRLGLIAIPEIDHIHVQVIEKMH